MEFPELNEGFYLETSEGLLFHVKGGVHPPDRVTAFLCYVPSSKGNRRRGKRKYLRIYDLNKSFNLLTKKYPKYLYFDPVMSKLIQSVPLSEIKEIYNPVEKIKELSLKKRKSELETLICEFVGELNERSGFSSSIGVSGSVLVGLETKDSDIDLVVYGERESRKVYSALKEMRREGEIKPYNLETVKRIVSFRWGEKAVSNMHLRKIEAKKILHGKIKGKDYFVRLVKKRSEIRYKYGELKFRFIGKGTITCEIWEDKDSIFTPCKYVVGNVKPISNILGLEKIKELTSFRGRFTEHVKKGEKVKVRGDIEEIEDLKEDTKYLHMVLGYKGDFLKPI